MEEPDTNEAKDERSRSDLLKMIEYPKHNGRFNLKDGSPARKPGCKAFKTHEVKVCDGRVFFRIGDCLVKI